MKVEITLTPVDIARLAEIRRLREAAYREWSSDEAMIASVVSLGLHEELLSERAYAEARENPFQMERGSLDFLARQVS